MATTREKTTSAATAACQSFPIDQIERLVQGDGLVSDEDLRAMRAAARANARAIATATTAKSTAAERQQQRQMVAGALASGANNPLVTHR